MMNDLSEMKEAFLNTIQTQGWTVERDPNAPFRLPESLQVRYPAFPVSLAEFLGGLKVCANKGQTAWFLCPDDFRGESASEFRWDEFEQMQLVWADTNDDKKAVISFWDDHIPFLLSTHTGYAFFAMALDGNRAGKIVHGLLEYGLDEAAIVAESLAEFLAFVLAGKFPAEVGPL